MAILKNGERTGASMESCMARTKLGGRFVPQCSMDSERYRAGIKLFNRAEFFEAHEVLEDVWRNAPPAEKKFLQGLIQVAVALHHHSKGNLIGARSLLSRAARNLSAYPEDFGGLQLTGLLRSITHWKAALAQGSSAPPLPKL